MEKITIGSYVRLKSDKSQIFRVFSISDEGDYIDAELPNNTRMSIEYNKVELASTYDIDKYTQNSPSSEIFIDD